MRLFDRDIQSLDGDRVFRADVDPAFVGADRIARDGHGFENDVRVAFEDGTVHERARVAFVRIAGTL